MSAHAFIPGRSNGLLDRTLLQIPNSEIVSNAATSQSRIHTFWRRTGVVDSGLELFNAQNAHPTLSGLYLSHVLIGKEAARAPGRAR
jgi:hypothetical protein